MALGASKSPEKRSGCSRLLLCYRHVLVISSFVFLLKQLTGPKKNLLETPPPQVTLVQFELYSKWDRDVTLKLDKGI